MKKLLTLLGFMSIAGTSYGTVYNVFNDTVTDLSGFTSTSGQVTVSGNSLSIEDTDTAGKPTALVDFDSNVIGGIRIELDYNFQNAGLTGVSDPEIRMRLGNLGTTPSSDATNGFGLYFRNPTGTTEDDSQVRAGEWNGTKISSNSTITSVPDNQWYSIDLFLNNSYGQMTYDFNGSTYTLEANTYSMFVDNTLLVTYALGETVSGGFDRDLGFGNLAFIGSSNSDAGVSVLFDNITIYTEADSGLTAVPEPSTYAAFAGLLVLGFATYRRRRA